MYYQDRHELDKISSAGVFWYENEHGNPVVRMNASFWLECEAEDTAFTENVKRTGNWEAWVATAIAREISEKRTTFFDIGANVGYYTLMSAMANVPTVSYEPDHSVFEMMLRSVALNKAGEGLWLRPQALSDKDEYQTYYISPNHSGSNTLVPQTDQEVERRGLEKIKIHVVSLDDELHNLPKFQTDKIVLKVDAEGSESRIWYGSKSFREEYKTVWFIEWVPDRGTSEENKAFLDDVLKTHDLQLVMEDGSLTPVGADEALRVNFETLVLRERE